MTKRIMMVMVALTILIGAQFSAGGENMFDNNTVKRCYPENHDLAAAAELGLATGDTYSDAYFELQAYYSEMLVAYIDSLASIRALDEAMEENELHLIPNDVPTNVYQEKASFGMKFFFLRNNVCIERLSRDELEALRAMDQNQLPGDDATVQAFISETMAKVTRLMPDKPDDMRIVIEPHGTAVPNAGIVFGFAMSAEFDADGNFVNAGHEREKNSFIEAALPEMSDELTGLLGLPVTVVQY